MNDVTWQIKADQWSQTYGRILYICNVTCFDVYPAARPGVWNIFPSTELVICVHAAKFIVAAVTARLFCITIKTKSSLFLRGEEISF